MPTLLSFPEPTDIAELFVARSRLGIDINTTNFAVEGLVLNDEGQVVLIKRGPMCRDNIGLLEGIGGQCHDSERFRDALHREIAEEVGTAAIIEIERFSHMRLQHEREGASGASAKWIVVSYICRWRSGPLTVTEPAKNSGFHLVDPHAFGAADLAPSARFSLNIYRASARQVSPDDATRDLLTLRE